jgi:RNA polymerase sigma-70 factor (ECF subfamily)
MTALAGDFDLRRFDRMFAVTNKLRTAGTDHLLAAAVAAGAREKLAGQFFRAVGGGDMDGLVSMLAEDVVVYGDSGGIGPSWPRPITGRGNVSRLLLGIGGQMRQVGITIRPTEINGQPGAMFLDPDGNLTNVFVLDIADGQVAAVRSVINPEKLRHLGSLADLPRLRRQLRPR